LKKKRAEARNREG